MTAHAKLEALKRVAVASQPRDRLGRWARGGANAVHVSLDSVGSTARAIGYSAAMQGVLGAHGATAQVVLDFAANFIEPVAEKVMDDDEVAALMAEPGTTVGKTRHSVTDRARSKAVRTMLHAAQKVGFIQLASVGVAQAMAHSGLHLSPELTMLAGNAIAGAITPHVENAGMMLVRKLKTRGKKGGNRNG